MAVVLYFPAFFRAGLGNCGAFEISVELFSLEDSVRAGLLKAVVDNHI